MSGFVRANRLISGLPGLERVPGQAQGSLLPPEPNLRQAVADVGAEAVNARGQRPEARGDWSNNVCYSPPPRIAPPVTKFVTPPAAVPAFADPSSTRIEKEMNPSRVLESNRGIWGDGYIVEKLQRRRLLKEELQTGETIMARRMEKLYATNPERARQLIGSAVNLPAKDGRQPNERAWLNVVLSKEVDAL